MVMRQIWLPFISAGLRYLLVNGANLPRSLGEQGQIYARFVAETALCCGRGGIKAWDYVRMGFLCRMGVLKSMADGRGKPVAAIAYLCAGVLFLRRLDAIFCRLFVGSAVLAG